MPELTQKQKNVITLKNAIDDLRSQAKDLQKQLTEEMSDLERDEIFQDPETLLCYRKAKAKGQFVEFYDETIERSRKPGETKGDISIKDCEAAGFKLSQ